MLPKSKRHEFQEAAVSLGTSVASAKAAGRRRQVNFAAGNPLILCISLKTSASGAYAGAEFT